MVIKSSTKTVFMIHKTADFHKNFGDVYHFEKNPDRTTYSADDKVSIQRNLWSFVVEAVLEYCRITFDLFSDSRPVRCLSCY